MTTLIERFGEPCTHTKEWSKPEGQEGSWRCYTIESKGTLAWLDCPGRILSPETEQAILAVVDAAGVSRPDDIARALDFYDRVTKPVVQSIAAMDQANAATCTVTLELTNGDTPISHEDARQLLEWMDGDEMQQCLRSLADAARTLQGGQR